MGVTGGTKTVDTTNLVFLMDASNPVSYTSGATKTYNLIGGQTGSVVNNTSYSSEGEAVGILMVLMIELTVIHFTT